MSVKTRSEIECLKRLEEIQGCYNDILAFLIAEKFIDQAEAKGMRSASDVAKEIQFKLMELSKAEKLQLVEYKWELLPIERISLYIVTNITSTTFSYNY
jgi:hypothetical protein